jgi:long-chain acyl-CoA synthetase
MAETASLISYNHRYKHKIGSVGTPAGIVEVKIVDPNGTAVPGGETGEIIIRGPNVLKGYVNKPKEKIASYKAPQKIMFVKDLPKSPAGKILKRVIRKSVDKSV